jgi:hypothetical protein
MQRLRKQGEGKKASRERQNSTGREAERGKQLQGDRIGGRCKLLESCRLKEAGACKQAYRQKSRDTSVVREEDA